jgi:hypothetical protein
MLEVMRVELAGRLPMLRRDVRVSAADEGRMVLDARRLLFASPLDLAAITALAHADADGMRGVTLLLPKDPDVTSYLQRMDVLRRLPLGTEICGSAKPEQRTDRSEVLLEVSPLSPATAGELVTRLGTLTAARLGRHARRVFQSAGELIDNAVSHGQSPLGAFMSAQAYTGATSRRPGFEFAVCDTGMGIFDHLRGNPSHAGIPDVLSALAYAIQPGVTGTDEQRGNGLADLLKITQGGVGRLVLRSGNGIASIALRHGQRRDAFADSSLTISGTWAWLRARFPLSQVTCFNRFIEAGGNHGRSVDL